MRENKLSFSRRESESFNMIPNIFSHEIDGKKCLLLAICESSKMSLLENNGVLGHVLQIILR